MAKWLGQVGGIAAAITSVLAFWQHQAGAGVLLVIGAVLLVFQRVTGPLLDRWTGRFVDWIDQSLRRRFSSFAGRYREFVFATLRFFDDKGLGTIGSYTPSLDQVFIDVSVAPDAPIHISPGVLSDDGVDQFTLRRTLAEFLDCPDPSVIALVGGPGVGKTTLLLHTARQTYLRRHRRAVPILLFLRDHVGTILGHPDISLPEVVRHTLGRTAEKEPTDWFERHLDDGRCVVLLDGLDEVGDHGDRMALATWTKQQIRQYPKNDFVITSRPHGYLTAPIDGATVLHPLRLTDEQVERFVHGWCQAYESFAAQSWRDGSGLVAARQRADSAARELIGRLVKAPELYELTANPMLLTMIVNVRHYNRKLPDSRADLYREICKVMLGRRFPATETGGLTADNKEMVLRGLAFEMMRRRVRDMRTDDVVLTVTPLLQRLPHVVTAAEFMADAGSSGIFVERETGTHAFAHLIFQEFLAATHIRERGLVAELTAVVDDVWWREVTLLYAARSDASPIIRACLESDSVTALSLAFDCLLQPGEIDPRLRVRLNELLDSAVNSDTEPERRELMAGAVVARHLRRPTLTVGATRICAHPITTNLYRLFLRVTGSQPPDEPWLLAPPGDGPITGVYGWESLAFARWVNTVTAGQVVCRLPYREELDDLVVQRALNATAAPTAAIWLHPKPGGAPELWLRPAHPHPHAISHDVLVDHLAADVRRLTSTLAGLLVLRSVVLLPAVTRARAAALASATPLDDELGGELRRSLDLARELNDEFNMTHGVELLRDLETDSSRAVARGRARGRPPARMDFVQALARVADKGVNPAAATRMATDAAATGDSANANQRTRELVEDLAHVLELMRGHLDPLADVLALDVAVAQGIGLARSFSAFLLRSGGLDPILNTDTGPVLDVARNPSAACERLLGKLLSRTLSTALRSTGPFQTEFETALLGGVHGPDRVVRYDLLADHVRSAENRLMSTGARWDAGAVAKRLTALAMPVFTWQETLTPARATAIRLAAVCLAAETDDSELSETFLEIASGVTLLERRTDGRAPLVETIMLAVT